VIPRISGETLFVRVGVTVFVAVALLAAFWRTGAAMLRLGDLAGQNSRLDYADREIGGGNGVIVDQAALYEARAAIPAHASYRFLDGSHLQSATALSAPFAHVYYRAFLMPRRQDPRARWIVCFGCDLATQAPGAVTVWQDSDGISIAKAPS
jgi:hypothetical protein